MSKPTTINQAALRDNAGIPLAWVVWIDDNMGYGAANWEIDNPADRIAEPLKEALEHAAETLARGYPTSVLPIGCTPGAATRSNTAMPRPARAPRPLYQFRHTARTKGHKSVLVYGPQGSGKTRHAEELRKHFDLAAVLEDWVPGDPWPIADHLVLSHVVPPDGRRRRAIPIEKALAKLRENAPGYPF